MVQAEKSGRQEFGATWKSRQRELKNCAATTCHRRLPHIGYATTSDAAGRFRHV